MYDIRLLLHIEENVHNMLDFVFTNEGFKIEYTERGQEEPSGSYIAAKYSSFCCAAILVNTGCCSVPLTALPLFTVI